MGTLFWLVVEYGAAEVPLALVSKRYFGVEPATAIKKASAGMFPLQIYKLSEEAKAPYYISLFELAQLIDLRRREAGALVADDEPAPTWLRYLKNGDYLTAIRRDLEDRARELENKDTK